MGVMVAWWDGQDLRSILSRLFFEHFNETSIIIENEENKEEIIGNPLVLHLAGTDKETRINTSKEYWNATIDI